MRWKRKKDMDAPGKTVSTAVLDFVFGEPLPEPDVVESDTEQAWQQWLDAMRDRELDDDFQDTQPMHLH